MATNARVNNASTLTTAGAFTRTIATTDQLTWSGITGTNATVNMGGAINVGNTASGGIAILSGQTVAVTINHTSAVVLTLGGLGIDASAAGANLTLGASGTTVTLALTVASTPLSVNTGRTVIFFSSASGAGFNFNKTGAGTAQFNSSNSGLTGLFTLGAGTVRIGNAGALGGATATLALNGGTLSSSTSIGYTITAAGASTIGGNITLGDFSFNGTLTFAAPFNLGAADRTLTLASNATFNSASILSGTAGIIKEGNGILTLQAANTFTGNVTINAGTLRTQISSTALGSSAVARNLTLASAGILDINTATTGLTSLSTFMSGSSVLALNAAALTVSSVSVTAGTPTLQFYNLTANTTFTAAGGVSVADGANLRVTNITSSFTGAVTSSITGLGSVEFNPTSAGVGRVQLNSANTAGPATVKYGQVVSNNANALNFTSLNANTAGQFTIASSTTSSAPLSISGTGGLFLSANASFQSITLNGPTSIRGSTATLANNVTIGIHNLTLSASGSNTLSITGNVGDGGSGALIFGFASETGTVALLAGSNTYSGQTSVSYGTANVLALNNGTLSTNTSIANGAVLSFFTGGSQVIAGELSGGGTLAKGASTTFVSVASVANGVLTVTGNNSLFGGQFRSTGGTLVINSVAAFGGATSITLSANTYRNATVVVPGGLTASTALTLAGTGQGLNGAPTGGIVVNSAGTTTFSGGMTFSNTEQSSGVFADQGDLVLSGAATSASNHYFFPKTNFNRTITFNSAIPANLRFFALGEGTSVINGGWAAGATQAIGIVGSGTLKIVLDTVKTYGSFWTLFGMNYADFNPTYAPVRYRNTGGTIEYVNTGATGDVTRAWGSTLYTSGGGGTLVVRRDAAYALNVSFPTFTMQGGIVKIVYAGSGTVGTDVKLNITTGATANTRLNGFIIENASAALVPATWSSDATFLTYPVYGTTPNFSTQGASATGLTVTTGATQNVDVTDVVTGQNSVTMSSVRLNGANAAITLNAGQTLATDFLMDVETGAARTILSGGTLAPSAFRVQVYTDNAEGTGATITSNLTGTWNSPFHKLGAGKLTVTGALSNFNNVYFADGNLTLTGEQFNPDGPLTIANPASTPMLLILGQAGTATYAGLRMGGPNTSLMLSGGDLRLTFGTDQYFAGNIQRSDTQSVVLESTSSTAATHYFQGDIAAPLVIKRGAVTPEIYNGAFFSNSPSVTVDGNGTLRVNFGSYGAYAPVSFGALNLASGFARIAQTTSSITTSDTQVLFSELTRSNKSTVHFDIIGSGAFKPTTPMTIQGQPDGLVGPWASAYNGTMAAHAIYRSSGTFTAGGAVVVPSVDTINYGTDANTQLAGAGASTLTTNVNGYAFNNGTITAQNSVTLKALRVGNSVTLAVGAQLATDSLLLPSNVLSRTGSDTTAALTTQTGDLYITTYTNLALNVKIADNAVTSTVTTPVFSGFNSNTISLNSNNTYTGNTYLYGSTVAILDDTALGNSSSSLIFSGGILNSASGATYPTIHSARPITILAGSASFNTASTLRLTGAISGSGDIYKVSSTGVLVISGANTGYSGTTRVLAGALVVDHNDALGTGPVLVTGSSSLVFTPNVTAFDLSSRLYRQIAAVSLQNSSTTSLTWTDPTASSITKTGGSGLVLAGTGRYSTLTINGGSVTVANAEAAPSNTSGAYVLNNNTASLRLGYPLTIPTGFLSLTTNPVGLDASGEFQGTFQTVASGAQLTFATGAAYSPSTITAIRATAAPVVMNAYAGTTVTAFIADVGQTISILGQSGSGSIHAYGEGTVVLSGTHSSVGTAWVVHDGNLTVTLNDTSTYVATSVDLGSIPFLANYAYTGGVLTFTNVGATTSNTKTFGTFNAIRGPATVRVVRAAEQTLDVSFNTVGTVNSVVTLEYVGGTVGTNLFFDLGTGVLNTRFNIAGVPALISSPAGLVPAAWTVSTAYLTYPVYGTTTNFTTQGAGSSGFTVATGNDQNVNVTSALSGITNSMFSSVRLADDTASLTLNSGQTLTTAAILNMGTASSQMLISGGKIAGIQSLGSPRGLVTIYSDNAFGVTVAADIAPLLGTLLTKDGTGSLTITGTANDLRSIYANNGSLTFTGAVTSPAASVVLASPSSGTVNITFDGPTTLREIIGGGGQNSNVVVGNSDLTLVGRGTTSTSALNYATTGTGKLKLTNYVYGDNSLFSFDKGAFGLDVETFAARTSIRFRPDFGLTFSTPIDVVAKTDTRIELAHSVAVWDTPVVWGDVSIEDTSLRLTKTTNIAYVWNPSPLTVASLTRTGKGTFAFIDNNGTRSINAFTVTSAPSLTNNIVGPWAAYPNTSTASSSSFLTYRTSGVFAVDASPVTTPSLDRLVYGVDANTALAAAGTSTIVSDATSNVRTTGAITAQATSTINTLVTGSTLNIASGATLAVDGIINQSAISGANTTAKLVSKSGDLYVFGATTNIITASVADNGATPTALIVSIGSTALTLSGTNTFTGGLYLNGSGAIVSSDTNLGGASNAIYLKGGELNVSSSFTLGSSRTINVGSNSGGAFAIGTGVSLTLDAPNQLVGSGRLSKTLSGSLYLNRANIGFTGDVLVGGSVYIADDLALGSTGSLNLGSGTLILNGPTGSGSGITSSFDPSSRFVTANDAVVIVDNSSGNTITFASGFGVAGGGFTKRGLSPIVLSGDNKFSTLFIDGGVLKATSANSLGTYTSVDWNSVRLNSLELEGGLTIPNTVRYLMSGAAGIADNGVLNGAVRVVSAGTTTLQGEIQLTSGSAVVYADQGDLVLTGNIYSTGSYLFSARATAGRTITQSGTTVGPSDGLILSAVGEGTFVISGDHSTRTGSTLSYGNLKVIVDGVSAYNATSIFGVGPTTGTSNELTVAYRYGGGCSISFDNIGSTAATSLAQTQILQAGLGDNIVKVTRTEAYPISVSFLPSGLGYGATLGFANGTATVVYDDVAGGGVVGTDLKFNIARFNQVGLANTRTRQFFIQDNASALVPAAWSSDALYLTYPIYGTTPNFANQGASSSGIASTGVFKNANITAAVTGQNSATMSSVRLANSSATLTLDAGQTLKTGLVMDTATGAGSDRTIISGGTLAPNLAEGGVIYFHTASTTGAGTVVSSDLTTPRMSVRKSGAGKLSLTGTISNLTDITVNKGTLTFGGSNPNAHLLVATPLTSADAVAVNLTGTSSLQSLIGGNQYATVTLTGGDLLLSPGTSYSYGGTLARTGSQVVRLKATTGAITTTFDGPVSVPFELTRMTLTIRPSYGASVTDAPSITVLSQASLNTDNGNSQNLIAYSTTYGALTLTDAAASINNNTVGQDPLFPARVTFASLTTTGRSSVIFTGRFNSLLTTTFTVAPTLTNNIIGPWAVVSLPSVGNGFATYRTSGTFSRGGAVSVASVDVLNYGVDLNTQLASVSISDGATANVALSANITAQASATINTLTTTNNTTTASYSLTMAASAVLTVNAVYLGGNINTTSSASIRPQAGVGNLYIFGIGTQSIGIPVVDNGATPTTPVICSGTVSYSNTNTYTGSTHLRGGGLVITADANLGAASAGIVFNGGTLTYTTAADMTTNRTVTLLEGNGFITHPTINVFTVAGKVSGAGRLIVSGNVGTGCLRLTDTTNDYSGGTTVGGVIGIASPLVLGSGNILFSGSTSNHIRLLSGITDADVDTLVAKIEPTGNIGLGNSTGAARTISVPMGYVGQTFYKLGTDDIVLSGSAIQGMNVSVLEGALVITNAQALGYAETAITATVTSGEALVLRGTFTMPNDVVAANYSLNGSGTATYPAALWADGGVVTTDGYITTTASATLGCASGANGLVLNGKVDFTDDTLTVRVDGTKNVKMTGQLVGNALTKTGSNILEVAPAAVSNAYTGATTVSEGTLLLSSEDPDTVLPISTSSAITVASGAVLQTATGTTQQGRANLGTLTLNGTLRIGGALILYVTADNVTKSYDGQAYSGGGGVTYTGFIDGDTEASLSGSLVYGGSAQGVTGAGTYSIIPSGLSSVKYQIVYVAGILTVNKVGLTVTAVNATKTYDSSLYSGGNGVTYAGFVNGETSSVLGGTLSYIGTSQGAKNVGSYALTPRGLTSQNYTVTFVSGSLAISTAALTITATNVSKTYGATPTLTAFTSVGLQGGETVGSVTLSSAGTVASASVAGGPYSIDVSNASGGTFSSSNYLITYVSGLLTVNTASLTVTAVNATKTYDGLGYSSGNGVTYAGFVNGENSSVLGGTLNYGGTSQGAIDVGTYTIVPSGLTSTNYTLAYVNGSLTVNTASLTVTAANASKTYDGAAYSGGNGVTYAGFVNGQTASVLGGTLSYGGTSQGAINEGTYSIVPSGLTSSNYILTFVSGVLTISVAAAVGSFATGPSYNANNQSVVVEIDPTLVTALGDYAIFYTSGSISNTLTPVGPTATWIGGTHPSGYTLSAPFISLRSVGGTTYNCIVVTVS
jgi:autotransporter-associated beta strand protein